MDGAGHLQFTFWQGIDKKSSLLPIRGLKHQFYPSYLGYESERET